MHKAFRLLLPALAVALLLDCSSKSTDSGPVDDTIPKKELSKAIISAGDRAFSFRLVPVSGGDSVWMSTTEITRAQFAAIMDTAASSSRLPQPAVWYDAARFANALSAAFQGLLDSLRDTLAAQGTDSIDPGFAFSAVYTDTLGDSTYAPAKKALGAYFCMTDSVPPAAAGARRTWEYPFKIVTCRVCSIKYSFGFSNYIKRALMSTVAAARPNTVLVPDSSIKRDILPPEYRYDFLADSLIRYIDTLLLHAGKTTDTVWMRAVRFALYAKVPGFEYNTPGPLPVYRYSPANNYMAFDVNPDTVGDTVYYHPARQDSAERTVRVTVWTDTPSVAFMRDSMDQVYHACHDSLTLPPDTAYAVDLWLKDTSVYGFRLPAEDEWEAAALGASGITYATYNGQLSEATAVYGAAGPSEVATKAPNPYMFYDMTGNLFEWTDDWWTDNGAYQLDWPYIYPKYVPFKVIKGGSFRSPASDPALKIQGCYSSHPASDMDGEIGFRVVIKNSTFWNYFRQ